jgi:hypothetical protein
LTVPSSNEVPAAEGGLQRRLGRRQMTMLGLGGAIGTGLFLGSGLAISEAGPGVIIAYAACALIALVIAFALAEMVSVHPAAGSFGMLAGKYLGPWAGFVVQWTYWAIQAIAIGGEMIAIGIYVQFWWPQLPLWLPVAVCSIALLVINAITVSLFGEVEYWFAMIKVVAIVAFILIGAAYLFFGLPGHASPGAANFTVHGGFLPKGWSGLGLAFVFVIFSYIGTEVVAVTAAESKDPARDIPRAARSMIVRLSLFYIIAIAIVVALVRGRGDELRPADRRAVQREHQYLPDHAHAALTRLAPVRSALAAPGEQERRTADGAAAFRGRPRARRRPVGVLREQRLRRDVRHLSVRCAGCLDHDPHHAHGIPQAWRPGRRPAADQAVGRPGDQRHRGTCAHRDPHLDRVHQRPDDLVEGRHPVLRGAPRRLRSDRLAAGQVPRTGTARSHGTVPGAVTGMRPRQSGRCASDENSGLSTNGSSWRSGPRTYQH